MVVQVTVELGNKAAQISTHKTTEIQRVMIDYLRDNAKAS